MTTAAEILKALKDKQKLTTPGTGVQAMQLLWKKRLGVNGWVKELTGKQVGQLKHVRAQAGDRAVKVLDFALSNWPLFAQEVHIQKGITPAMSPDCGFFCQHWDVALKMIEILAHPVVQPKHVMQSIAVKSSTVGAPSHGQEDNQGDDQLATDEDIQSTLAALQSLSGKSG